MRAIFIEGPVDLEERQLPAPPPATVDHDRYMVPTEGAEELVTHRYDLVGWMRHRDTAIYLHRGPLA